MTTKDQVLEELQAKTNEYVSGSQIASHLNISRNAIWKAIEQLRADGYKIEAVTHKGYKLIALSDKLVPYIISRYLKNLGVDEELIAPIYFYNEVTSTNTAAKEHVSEGAPHGTSIIARIVTHSKLVHREPDASEADNLYTSIIFHPGRYISIESLEIIHMCIVAVFNTLKEMLGITCEIKDTDNLYYKGKKIAEIFTEGAGEIRGGKIKLTTNILGIGIFGKGFSLNRSLFMAKLLKRLIYDKPDPDETEKIFEHLCGSRA